MRSWDESSTQGGDLNWSLEEYHPHFWICLTFCLHHCSHILREIKPFQNKILQIFWIDTQFHEMALNFAHFTDTLKLDMKYRLEGQTRAQRQGDSMDNFILLELQF